MNHVVRGANHSGAPRLRRRRLDWLLQDGLGWPSDAPIGSSFRIRCITALPIFSRFHQFWIGLVRIFGQFRVARCVCHQSCLSSASSTSLGDEVNQCIDAPGDAVPFRASDAYQNEVSSLDSQQEFNSPQPFRLDHQRMNVRMVYRSQRRDDLAFRVGRRFRKVFRQCLRFQPRWTVPTQAIRLNDRHE